MAASRADSVTSTSVPTCTVAQHQVLYLQLSFGQAVELVLVGVVGAANSIWLVFAICNFCKYGCNQRHIKGKSGQQELAVEFRSARQLAEDLCLAR